MVCFVSEDRVPLYVRLPSGQAAALDRLVDATGRRKQQIVSDLLADRLEMGRVEIRERSDSPAGEVLDLQDAAELLRVPVQAVRALAQEGGLPGRRIGEEWRFSRTALLAWLSQQA